MTREELEDFLDDRGVPADADFTFTHGIDGATVLEIVAVVHKFNGEIEIALKEQSEDSE